MHWKDADPATLRKLFHGQQMGYRQIAEQFVDATVGKVAGRCRRLGLVRGTSKTLGLKRKPVASAAPEPEREPDPPKLREEPAKPGTLKLEQLDARACRWPFGDPQKPDFGFCGMTQKEGSPYCADHHRMSHVGGKS